MFYIVTEHNKVFVSIMKIRIYWYMTKTQKGKDKSKYKLSAHFIWSREEKWVIFSRHNILDNNMNNIVWNVRNEMKKYFSFNKNIYI